MRDIHVRLDRQAEPRCGYDHDSATWMNRCYGVSAYEQITLGLIYPQATEMALRAPIDPLALALQVRHEIFFAPAWVLLRYQIALDRENARIIEEGRQRHLEALHENKARDAAAASRARGTRSTRRHGKKRGGR